MTHATLLTAGFLALLVAAWLAGGRRAGGPPGARRAAERIWIAGATFWLAEVGATVLGLGVPPPREPWRAPQEPIALSIGGVDVPEDWVRARTETPLVAFVGDSFTAGQGVTEEGALPDQTRVALADRGVVIDDRNEGRPGDSFTWEVDRYAALASNLDPDMVVWVFVLNDFELPELGPTDDFITDQRLHAQTGSRVVDALLQGLRDRRLGAATEAAYHQALAPDSAVWATHGATLKRLVAERRDAGGRFLFVIYPLLHQLDRYPFAGEHARIAAWAREAGAEVVDLLPTFTGLDAPRLWVSTQDHHPNGSANHLAARAIADAIGARPVARARPTRCDALPLNPSIAAPLQTACQARDSASALTLSDAASGPAFRLSGPMAVVGAWRAIGTPDEAAARARAESILARPERGHGAP